MHKNDCKSNSMANIIYVENFDAMKLKSLLCVLEQDRKYVTYTIDLNKKHTALIFKQKLHLRSVIIAQNLDILSKVFSKICRENLYFP